MSESFLDFDALVAPISESQPCGSNFDTGDNVALNRAFSEFRALTPFARKIESKRFELASMSPADRQESLSHSEGKSDGPQADPQWRRISDLAVEILTSYSKDTRVMVGLIESATRLNGLPGMRDAFKVCVRLLDDYKLNLFPTPEPGESPYYCLEFFGKICESEMNNMKAAIYQFDAFENHPGFNWFSHIAATNLENREDSEREECIRSGDLSLEHFRSVLKNISNVDELNDFDAKISEAMVEAKNFDSMLSIHSDRRIGIGRILEDLAKLQRWYRALIEDRLTELNAMAPVQPDEHDSITGEDQRPMAEAGTFGVQASISNRTQALNNLLQVAAYFRKAEPHSPVSYALEQAVRWGKLSLPELLRDLVSDESVLAEMYRRMGIQDSLENSDG